MLSRSILFLPYLCLFMNSSQGNADLGPTFFNKGKQKCNCFNNVPCSETGRCPKDRCATNFVGITCQHAAVQTIDRVNTDLPYTLLDGDHTTCTNNKLTMIVFSTLKSKKSLYYFWIYVSRKERESMAPKVWEMHDKPLNIHKYDSIVISTTSILIKPKNKHWYQSSLGLSRLPQDTCTVEVGIGRNLALKGKADLSYKGIDNKKKVSNAHRAVDGYEGTSRPGKHCSLPQIDTTAWWTIYLSFKARVNLITLLSPSNTKCQKTAFTVHTDYSSKSSVSRYKMDVNDKLLSKYFIEVAAVISKVSVAVSKSEIDTIISKDASCSQGVWLPLCEVEVFGEFVCPQHKFGAFCDITCPGCTSENCIPDWGCVKGCTNGGKGPWCKKDQDGETTKIPDPDEVDTNCKFKNSSGCNFFCSENCAGAGECNRANGHCLEGCKPGYYPEECTENCTSGYYGIDCSDVCSHCSQDNETNEHLCDFVTGNCSHGCAQGYTGEYCEFIPSPNDISASDVLFISSLIAVAVIVTLTLYIVLKYNKRNMSEGDWYEGWEEWAETEDDWDFPPESFFEGSDFTQESTFVEGHRQSDGYSSVVTDV